jgi:hypothetical protein
VFSNSFSILLDFPIFRESSRLKTLDPERSQTENSVSPVDYTVEAEYSAIRLGAIWREGRERVAQNYFSLSELQYVMYDVKNLK